MRLNFTLVLFFCTCISYAQNRISEINFEGLVKTKDSYVRRFLSLSEGNVFDSIRYKNDIQRLKNLQLFYEVESNFKDSTNKFFITYKVKEVVTTLPVLGLGWTDQVFWSEVGAMELNTLGKGIQSIFKHRFYQRHSYFLFLRNPHYKSSKWGYEIHLNRFATIEPLYYDETTQFYDYDNNSLNIGVMYWLFQTNSIGINVQYIYESYNKNFEFTKDKLEGPLEHKTNKFLTKLSNQLNKVDYNDVRLDGINNYFSIEGIYSKIDYERFVKLCNEFKYFKYLGDKGNFASRIRVGVSTNNDSPFAAFVADNYINVRGVGDRVLRGTAELSSNLEYRYLFVIKNSIRVTGVAFSDFGMWRNPGEKLKSFLDLNDAKYYSGIGLRLHYLKVFNAVFRVDYSFNLSDLRRRAFVIGVGQYF